MSQWVPSPKSLPQAHEDGARTDSSDSRVEARFSPDSDPRGPSKIPNRPVVAMVWPRISPFFMSAFFYLSAFLAVLSPLPILLLGMRKGRGWAWFAAFTNTLIVGFLGGKFAVLCFSIFIIALSLSLIESLFRKKSIEASAIISWSVVAVLAVGMGFAYAHLNHLSPIDELRSQISEVVDYLAQSSSVSNPNLMTPSDADEWKRNLLIEFPSAIGIFVLILIWSNLTLLLKANPGGLREKLGLDSSFSKKWKAPEYLVWPTIFSGVFLVADFGFATDIAINVFKVLMAVYAIQGLSILSYFFDLWNVRGVFRWIGFTLSLFLMMPLVLSLGFFDLWFDIRSKFRQS